ncbi:DUF5344 family protein [Bacillus sp. FSL W7-1360]
MELQINVEEVNTLLQGVAEIAGSFQSVSVSTSSDDLDGLSELDAVKEELDGYVKDYMNALYQTEMELQALIQGYEVVDKELAGKMG